MSDRGYAMLHVANLKLGSIDAINYKARTEKEFLSKVFYRDEILDRILDPHKYYIIGEKGTGKTAYSVLLNNMDYHNTRSSVFSLGETDYRKFIALKNDGYLSVSDYNDAWRVIILLLTANHLREREPKNLLEIAKFKEINGAIDEYYRSAFSPEITRALEFVEHSEISAQLVAKAVGAAGKEAERNCSPPV